MSKKTEVFTNILIWVIILVVVNLFLFVIQSVKSYTYEPNSGNEVVIGFDRGFGGVFSSWGFELDNQGNITVKKRMF